VESLAVKNFWDGRRVLVTGHTGFKGSWLCLWLERLGADVTGLALEPATDPNLFDVARVSARTKSKIGDIRDYAFVRRSVAGTRPEIIFHLAAQPLVRQGYDAPVETFSTNVLGTAHLLEAVRQESRDTRAIVVITSDKCYENLEWVWPYREDDRLGGHDPYASSKACTELVVRAFWKSYFSASVSSPALASARAGNVIGGGDWAPYRLVPDLMRGFVCGQRVAIRNPDAVRPWQHVLDALHGYLLLAEKMHNDRSFAEPWNFGPEDADSRSVRSVVEQATALWGDSAGWEEVPDRTYHEAGLLRLDSSKARSRLGWRSRLNVNSAVEWTVDWYKKVSRGADARECVESQISLYESLSH
jgi:CDP-glucose 4,6-dehydratase